MSDTAAFDHATAIVIPAYNAGRHLGGVLERVLAVVPRDRIWVVDDGSTDATAAVAAQHQVNLIRQSPNQGKAAALRTGFDATRAYERVITLDADGQHDPADLPRFLEAARAHRQDLVVGARTLGEGMPGLRAFGNRISSKIIGALAGCPIPDSQSGYRLHARALIDSVAPAISPDARGFLFETELLVRAGRQGYRIGSVPIATVYADQGSHFHPGTELPRFLSLFARLTYLVASGQAGRRATPASAPSRETTTGTEARW
ncbi:MAG TPA: glycosyltransferase family 2 protein [Candidatus Eisenbacteria bacterium]|nr:glycosyltransferase family 2 protein [Candidatus Eisenbacteria bacterium]